MPVSSEGMIPLDRLKEFIEGTIKDKYEVSTKSSHMYAKPYNARIDNFKMPAGYQPPIFQQFEGKGYLKRTLWRHVIMLEHMETILSNSLSAL